MRVLSIETQTHGRVVVDDDDDGSRSGLLVAFHGYGQNAEGILSEVRQIPGVSGWRVAAVQALHRFYGRDDKILASWMTREDRERAIADNVEYVNRAIDQVLGPRPQAPAISASLPASPPPGLPIVFLGFSQGASMAYRAALLGRHRASGIIALGGDIPPELKSATFRDWPPVLIGAGVSDGWYHADKLAADIAWLQSHHVDHHVVRFLGGHEWTNAFRQVVGERLSGPA